MPRSTCKCPWDNQSVQIRIRSRLSRQPDLTTFFSQWLLSSSLLWMRMQDFSAKANSFPFLLNFVTSDALASRNRIALFDRHIPRLIVWTFVRPYFGYSWDLNIVLFHTGNGINLLMHKCIDCPQVNMQGNNVQWSTKSGEAEHDRGHMSHTHESCSSKLSRIPLPFVKKISIGSHLIGMVRVTMAWFVLLSLLRDTAQPQV